MQGERADIIAAAAARALEPSAVAAAERSLWAFVRLGWHVVEPLTPFVEGPHLRAVCEHLQAVTEGRIRNLLINIPPRHMKSLAACVFWPAWEWISWPQRRWLFASYALSLSERDSVKCRRLIESPWYQARWGKRYMLCGDQNTKLRFENNRAGHRIATSVGGSATGEGGDRVVVDDPHNVAQRESDTIRNAALAWWDQTMSTRLNDPRSGAKVVIMQRVHENDLSGHVLAQGGYEHLCLAAEFEPARRCATAISWSDWRKKEGDPLWPARIGPRELADFKLRLGPDGYAGQFQQRPAPAGGGRFKAQWFRYYLRDAGGAYLLQKPANAQSRIRADQCQRIAVMDPAGAEPGDGNHPCYTVIQVWDLAPGGDLLLVHQYRAQVQAPDAAAAAVDVCRKFDVAFIAIEKDGLGLGVVQSVRGSGLTVRALKARGPKEARSETAEIRMAAGQIYFPRGAPFLFELEHELLQFPRGQYADQVDALAYAALLAHKGGETGDRPGELNAAGSNSADANDPWETV